MGRTKGSKNKPKDQPQSDPGTGLARSNDPVNVFLNERKNALQGYAVRNYDHGGFMRSAFLAISESPKLSLAIKTGTGQRSLYNALRYAAATGLSLNPQMGKAALVPYPNRETGDVTVNYQIMKNGLIDLVMETGAVRDLVADLVRENDRFEVTRTQENDSYVFVPARKNRGDIDGFFAAITLTTGRTHIAYMAIEEIEDHRDRYNASRALGNKSPWVHSWKGMAIKTVIKKLLRNLHLSPETGAAVAVDDASEFGGDVIDMVADDPPIRERKPRSTPEETPESPPDPPADTPEPDQKGETAEDIAARLTASDEATNDQAGAEDDADGESGGSII